MSKEALDSKIYKLVESGNDEDINKGLKLLYYNYALELEKFLRNKRIVIIDKDYGDMIQTTIVIFWKNIQENKIEKIPGKLLSYLKGVAHNVYFSELKKHLKEKEHIDSIVMEVHDDLDLEMDLQLVQDINDSRKKNLFACLNLLSEENRTIITKYYFEGFSGEQLALQYNQNLNWVNQRLYQNRLRLRKCISKKKTSNN